VIVEGGEFLNARELGGSTENMVEVGQGTLIGRGEKLWKRGKVGKGIILRKRNRVEVTSLNRKADKAQLRGETRIEKKGGEKAWQDPPKEGLPPLRGGETGVGLEEKPRAGKSIKSNGEIPTRGGGCT